MAEVELTISSAKDLKNVNWRHGPIRPYAVVWVDPNNKVTTKVDEDGDTCPSWDQTLNIPLPGPVDDETTLCIDIVHAGNEEGIKKLIGSAKLKLKEIQKESGYGERVKRNLKLKRPSGRPHGKLDVSVSIREAGYRSREVYYAPPYGVPPPNSGNYAVPPPYGIPYGGAPPPYGTPYGGSPPPYGNPYGGGGAPPPNPYSVAAAPVAGYPYGNPQPYGQQPGYGGGSSPAAAGYYGKEEKKKGKFGGMSAGTGMAVGAVGGVLGGLALAEGFDALEDKIADDAAAKVEDDLGYDDDDF